jgi:hypothetical protein
MRQRVGAKRALLRVSWIPFQRGFSQEGGNRGAWYPAGIYSCQQRKYEHNRNASKIGWQREDSKERRSSNVRLHQIFVARRHCCASRSGFLNRLLPCPKMWNRTWVFWLPASLLINVVTKNTQPEYTSVLYCLIRNRTTCFAYLMWPSPGGTEITGRKTRTSISVSPVTLRTVVHVGQKRCKRRSGTGESWTSLGR